MTAAKRAGAAAVAAGAALLLLSLSLFLYNQRQDEQAGWEAERLLPAVQAAMQQRGAPEPAAPEEGTEPAPPAATPDLELPEVEIDGYGCVGSLSIPALDLELPVLSEWDDARLKIAPCRQSGSSRTDDLVIAAHNYRRHFGKLSGLVPGDRVLFTEMDGKENNYAVVKVEKVAPTAVEDVLSSGYDLVLYTCTYGGKARVAVFCTREV